MAYKSYRVSDTAFDEHAIYIALASTESRLFMAWCYKESSSISKFRMKIPVSMSRGGGGGGGGIFFSVFQLSVDMKKCEITSLGNYVA